MSVKSVRLENVGARLQILAMDFLHDFRSRDVEKIVEPLQIAVPVLETVATIIRFLELVALDHGAHRAVDDDDPLGKPLQ